VIILETKTKNETISIFLHRVLNRDKKIDYLIAFFIGAVPVTLSYFIGIHKIEADGYLGYWDTPNWTSLALLLPIILYALRWAMAKIAPVVAKELTNSTPPIINVLPNDPAKKALYIELRQCILSRTNLLIALALTVLVTVLDMWNVYERLYHDSNEGALDWTTAYIIVPEIVSKSSNIIFIFFAYLAQFTATFMGILVIVLFYRHNRFFIRHIYQRRWMQQRKTSHYFQIDINDVNRCFGFRPTNEAFNTQVKALMIAGAAMFISRFAHALHSVTTNPSSESSSWPAWLPGLSFPVPGQWLMALFWLLGLFIVAMPSLIKLLPWLRSAGSEHVHLSVDHYLREFFSDESWPKNQQGEDETVEQVAAKFARNSFWPTGDNRARTLFLFSYWVFFVILLPPVSANLVPLILTFAAYGIAAYLATVITFAGLKLALRYVDDMLVVSNHRQIDDRLEDSQPNPEKSDLGIFISYRRRETAPYARSILESLQEDFHQEKLFMDIDSIQPGVKFGQEIEKALNRVDSVIVLIGREWTTMTDEDGNPRLTNPKDMVRFEVATALAQNKRIFPVLVGDAVMPEENDLPEPLKELSHFNAVELSDKRWEYDMGVLVSALKQTTETTN